MVPKKSAAISRQKILNSARPEHFNQTFGQELKKINLVPKVVKIKKPVVNTYKEIPHQELTIDSRILQRKKLV